MRGICFLKNYSVTAATPVDSFVANMANILLLRQNYFSPCCVHNIQYQRSGVFQSILCGVKKYWLGQPESSHLGRDENATDGSCVDQPVLGVIRKMAGSTIPSSLCLVQCLWPFGPKIQPVRVTTSHFWGKNGELPLSHSQPEFFWLWWTRNFQGVQRTS